MLPRRSDKGVSKEQETGQSVDTQPLSINQVYVNNRDSTQALDIVVAMDESVTAKETS